MLRLLSREDSSVQLTPIRATAEGLFGGSTHPAPSTDLGPLGNFLLARCGIMITQLHLQS